MGASESTPSSAISSPSTGSVPSPFIFKLYSKQFETGDDDRNKTELYLDGYGEEDSLTDEEENIPVETPSASVEDEDDYPIDKLNANIDNDAHVTEEDETLVVDIKEAFELSKQKTQSELDSRFPSMPVKGSPCESERILLMQCYKENDDILNCREFVEKYSTCAKSATSTRMNNQ